MCRHLIFLPYLFYLYFPPVLFRAGFARQSFLSCGRYCLQWLLLRYHFNRQPIHLADAQSSRNLGVKTLPRGRVYGDEGDRRSECG